MVMPIQAGIIGAGIGKFHMQGYDMHPLANVQAVCDINQVAAIAAAEKYGARWFTDYQEMITDPAIDCVSVCVPNALHMPVVMDCLAAGKHVLCEKPLARNAKEGEKMVAAAKKAGKKFMIQFNNRYRPEAKVLKEYVDSGEIGDIYYADCGWIRRNGIPGWGGWFTQKELAGGGPLLDLGVHMLDLTMWLMGNPEPECVLAMTFKGFGKQMEALGPWGTPDKKGKFDVEDMGVAMIRFVGGKSLVLKAGWAGRIKREFVYSTVMGTNAGASLERVFAIDGVDDSSIDTLEVFTQEHGVPVNRSLVVEPDPAMGRHNAVKHFVDCLLDDKVQMISPASDGLRIMKILDAAYKSAATGKAVNIK